MFILLLQVALTLCFHNSQQYTSLSNWYDNESGGLNDTISDLQTQMKNLSMQVPDDEFARDEAAYESFAYIPDFNPSIVDRFLKADSLVTFNTPSPVDYLFTSPSVQTDEIDEDIVSQFKSPGESFDSFISADDLTIGNEEFNNRNLEQAVYSVDFDSLQAINDGIIEAALNANSTGTLSSVASTSDVSASTDTHDTNSTSQAATTEETLTDKRELTNSESNNTTSDITASDTSESNADSTTGITANSSTVQSDTNVTSSELVEGQEVSSSNSSVEVSSDSTSTDASDSSEASQSLNESLAQLSSSNKNLRRYANF